MISINNWVPTDQWVCHCFLVVFVVVVVGNGTFRKKNKAKFPTLSSILNGRLEELVTWKTWSKEVQFFSLLLLICYLKWLNRLTARLCKRLTAILTEYVRRRKLMIIQWHHCQASDAFTSMPLSCVLTS